MPNKQTNKKRKRKKEAEYGPTFRDSMSISMAIVPTTSQDIM